jgi:hypothetical protein
MILQAQINKSKQHACRTDAPCNCLDYMRHYAYHRYSFDHWTHLELPAPSDAQPGAIILQPSRNSAITIQLPGLGSER